MKCGQFDQTPLKRDFFVGHDSGSSNGISLDVAFVGDATGLRNAMRNLLIAPGLTVFLLAPTLIAAQSLSPPAAVRQSQATKAQTPVVSPAMRAVCDRELQQYCSGVQPGGGRLIQCLAPRLRDLSEGCKTFL